MNIAFLLLIVFVATFTQSLTGFGASLVAMPLLTSLIGIRLASPLMSLIALTIQVILLLRYREAFDLRVVWRLVAAAWVGVPLGVFGLRRLDEQLVTTVLGLVIAGYALYALISPRLPELRATGWAYGFGFVAGLLSGAYNVPGPPVVVYGHCRQWPPLEFKSNLQGFFLLNSVMLIATHALSRNYTGFIWQSYLVTWPAIGLGIWAGASLDKRLRPELFRRLVLGLLIVLGLRLIF